MENVNDLYWYMRVLANHLVHPIIVPLDELRTILAHVKQNMKLNPRLKLPEALYKNIRTYYSVMRITPIVNDDFLLLTLTI